MSSAARRVAERFQHCSLTCPGRPREAERDHECPVSPPDGRPGAGAEHPLVRRRAAQPLARRVQTALHTEVDSIAGARINVDAVERSVGEPRKRSLRAAASDSTQRRCTATSTSACERSTRSRGKTPCSSGSPRGTTTPPPRAPGSHDLGGLSIAHPRLGATRSRLPPRRACRPHVPEARVGQLHAVCRAKRRRHRISGDYLATWDARFGLLEPNSAYSLSVYGTEGQRFESSRARFVSRQFVAFAGRLSLLPAFPVRRSEARERFWPIFWRTFWRTLRSRCDSARTAVEFRRWCYGETRTRTGDTTIFRA